MKRETNRWVCKAEADLNGANDLAQAARPYHDLICFHCQQSAEKYLKALLTELGLSVPKTHRLEDLWRLLVPHVAELRNQRRTVVSLTRFAVDYRYPGECATKREATSALQQAAKLRTQIRACLGLPP